VDSGRRRVSGSIIATLPDETIAGSLSDKNFLNPDAVLEITRDVIQQAGARGFEICVVIPDESSRIAFLSTESPPSKPQEREAFVRWKLKKSVPFDVDSAQVAYKVLGPSSGDVKGVDILVALSPRSIIVEYETLLERLGFHAGYVVPSTLAVLSLFPAPVEDVLLVKLAPESITTTVFQNRRPQFFRRVGNIGVYDAVYPTVMYYQDKLGGAAFSSAVVCGYDRDPRPEIEELQEKLGVPVRRMDPKNVDDIYKPALGALDWVWANSI
jgi:type IV pilus assembly protein PilM